MLRKKRARLYLEFTEALGSMICMQWVLQTLQYIRLQRLWRFLQRMQEAMKPNICDKVRFRSITALNCMLKESRKNRHPCLVSDFRSKAISFFLVNIVVVVVTLFFWYVMKLLLLWDMLLLIHNFFSTFIRTMVNSAKALFCIYGKDSVISVIKSAEVLPWTLNYWFVYVDISLHLCADHDSSYSQCVFDFRLEEFYWNFYIYVHKKNWFVLCSHPHPLLPTWCVLITCRYQVSYDFITFDGKGYLSFFSGNFRCFDVRSSVNVFFH